MKILLGITCYRCEKQIARVLDKLAKSPILVDLDYVAVIDNQSPDNTIKVALDGVSRSELKVKAYVYKNDSNYGLGGSHKVIFDLAKEKKMDYVFILHGDDQAEVDDLMKMLSHLKMNPEVSAVLGSRFSFESKLIGYQKKRIFGNLVLNSLYSTLCFRKVSDLGSGLNLYRVRDLEDISYYELSSRFTFNAELMLKMFSSAKKIHFLPITWKEEDQESNAGNFSVAKRLFWVLMAWRFSHLPSEKPRSYTSKLVS